MGKLRANQSVIVMRNGKPLTVRKNDLIDQGDLIVRDYPWLFTEEPGVESATAAPGEKRSTRVPKTK